MRPTTIARNYAEALLELATRAKDLRGWGTLLEGIAEAMGQDQGLRTFLETPRIDAAAKNVVLRKALTDRAPEKFVRFVESVVSHRRCRPMLAAIISHLGMMMFNRSTREPTDHYQ